MGVIYLRTNLINGMKYVGQSKNFSKRERQWKCLKLRYANQLLNEDRNQYGLDCFKTEILAECNDSELDEKERYYIKELGTLYPNGYNTHEGGAINFHHSVETKEKIRQTKLGDKNPAYGKKAWNHGVKCNKEWREKLSESHIGNTSALGHVLTEESKQRISMSKKGVPNKKLMKKVIQVKPNGETVEWESVKECKDKGFNGVDRVCRGERKQAYGCKWYYK